MIWDEYLLIKKDIDNGFEKIDLDTTPKVEKRIEIKNDEDYKAAKNAIEKYEEDNFNLTYEDFEKMEKVFNNIIDGMKYKDDAFDESYLERIVRVMKFLDWHYGFEKKDVTEEMLLETVNDLFANAMRDTTKFRSKKMTTSTGGWTIKVDFEQYKVDVFFSVFDDSVTIDDLVDEWW